MLKLLCSFIFVCLSVARADFVDYIVDSKIAQPANQNLVRLYDVRATGTGGWQSSLITRMGQGGRSDIPGVFGAGRAEGLGAGSGGTRAIPSSGGSGGSSIKFIGKRLDPREGQTGLFRDLDKIGKKGDNLTPDHMPQSAYMKSHGVSHRDGVAMMIEHPVPGVGGRYRMTRTYGKQPDLSAAPRQELARDIADRRIIYRKQGEYTPDIHQGLKEVIQKNKDTYPNLFQKWTQ